jgi:hypothetical protein
VKRSRYRPVIEEEERTIDDFAGRYSIFTIESMEEEVGTGQQAFIQINTDGKGNLDLVRYVATYKERYKHVMGKLCTNLYGKGKMGSGM